MINYSNKKSSPFNKKRLLILIAVVLVVGAGIGTTFALFHNTSLEEQNQKQTENNDSTSGIKESKIDDNGTGSDLPSKGGIDNNLPSEDTYSQDAPPEQPNFIRADYSNSLKVVATFQQASTGFCELDLTKDGVTRRFEASIVLGTSYYSCSFDIASTSIPSKGEWKAIVLHHVGELQTASISRSIEVN